MPRKKHDKPNRAKWDRALGRRLVFASDGKKKYEQRFGVSVSRPLLAGWIRKGHVKRYKVLDGRSSILVEADLAYCVEVHAWRIAVKMPKTVPLLAKDGSPAEPSYLSAAEATREYRRRKALGISLRPRNAKKRGGLRPKPRSK